MTDVIRFSSVEEMRCYLNDLAFKETFMATQSQAQAKTQTQQKVEKRKDDSLAELQRVVSQLKDLASLHGKILGEVVNEIVDIKTPKKEEQKKPRISDVFFGYAFKRMNGMYCMRCRPTSYLLNSTLVSESLAAGKQLIMNVKEGTVFFVENEEISV